MFNGLIGFTLAGQNGSQIIVSLGKAGIYLQRPVEMFDGLIKFSLTFQGIAKVVVWPYFPG